MEIKESLRNIGMEDNEAKIYLYLWKKGPCTQQTISDETNILRQTVYEVMKKMEAKGFVSISLVGKRKSYIAAEPKHLLNQLKEKEEFFSEALPEFEKIKSLEQIFLNSQSFVGMAGLKNLFSLTLESKSEILWLANKETSDKIFQGYYWHNYAKKRIQKKIPIKLIIEPTKQKDWDTDKKIFRETRRNSLADKEKSSFVLFDDKIIIYSLIEDKLQGVFIQDKATKQLFEKMFYDFWERSK